MTTRFLVDRRFEKAFESKSRSSPSAATATDRTAYSAAASGSTQPLKMSAQAGSCKRARADFEGEGAPTEADAATAPTEPSRTLLEARADFEVELVELEAKLATSRTSKNRRLRFVDHVEATMNLTAELLEGMKEEIGDDGRDDVGVQPRASREGRRQRAGVPAAASENPELAQMVSLLEEAMSLLEGAATDALSVEGGANQYAMFTATWVVKHFREEVNKWLVSTVHTGEKHLIGELVAGANRNHFRCYASTSVEPYQSPPL